MNEIKLREGSYLSKPLSGLDAHSAVMKGLSVDVVLRIKKSLKIIDEAEFLKVLGISARTLHRKATGSQQLLDGNASDRALRLASILELATGVLGSQDEAERWLSRPAIGLSDNRPIELLQSSEGTDLVKTLLMRMDYGVYS